MSSLRVAGIRKFLLTESFFKDSKQRATASLVHQRGNTEMDPRSQILWMVHKSGDHRLRWVVDPIIYIPGFFEIQTVVVGDFSINSTFEVSPSWMVSMDGFHFILTINLPSMISKLFPDVFHVPLEFSMYIRIRI